VKELKISFIVEKKLKYNAKIQYLKAKNIFEKKEKNNS